MASMASLAFTTPSVQMSKPAAIGPSAIGLGPRSIVVPTSAKSNNVSPRRLSVVVRAQKYESDSHRDSRDFKVDRISTDELGEDLLDTSRFELIPWDFKEDANKINLWFNMPGVASQDIRVYVKDNKLFVQGKHYDLPLNIRKEAIKAKLGNGILYVSVPKTKPDFEPYPVLIMPVSW